MKPYSSLLRPNPKSSTHFNSLARVSDVWVSEWDRVIQGVGVVLRVSGLGTGA